jgi:hypothetical protein
MKPDFFPSLDDCAAPWQYYKHLRFCRNILRLILMLIESYLPVFPNGEDALFFGNHRLTISYREAETPLLFFNHFSADSLFFQDKR